MSIQLLGTYGYFTRFGAWAGEYNRITALYGTGLSNGFQSIWSQYATSEQAAVVNMPGALSAYQQTPQDYLAALVLGAQDSSILQVNRDSLLTPYTFVQSVLNVIAQMQSTAQTVNQPTVTGSVSAGGSNVGDAVFVTSIKNAYGVQSDTIYAETVVTTCSDTSTPYSEVFDAVGLPAVPYYDATWPKGSGSNNQITLTDPAVDAIITDGMMNVWEGTGNNTPTFWTIVNGTAGTQVVRGSSPVRTGYAYNANLVSDGTSTTRLTQQVLLQPNTVYAFAVQAKMSTTDGTGVFRIALTNAAGGTVLTDDAGNNLSQTYTMSSGTPSNTNVGSTYRYFIVFFATPKKLPTSTFIEYGFTTAPSSTKVLSLSMAAGAAATQLYNQGPFLIGFSGAVSSAISDVYDATYTNSLGTQSVVRSSQRLLDLPNLGPKVYWPSSNSPTIPDSVVTN